MTAGRGIVHSERTPADARRRPEASLFGVQTWVALPKPAEEAAPEFAHHEAETLPEIEDDGVRVRLIAGTLGGRQSPLAVFSPMFFADAALDAGARLDVPAEHEERTIYVAEGRITIGGAGFENGRLLVLRPGQTVPIAASAQSRLLLLGGAPLDGPRHLWWNFLSSSRDRVEHAKLDWRAGRFAALTAAGEHLHAPVCVGVEEARP